MPSPHRSPSTCNASREARLWASVCSAGANSWIVSSVLITLRNTVQSPLPKGMGTRLPDVSFFWSNITSERNTHILPAAQLRARYARVGPRLVGMLGRCYDLGVKNLLERKALEPVEAHDDAYPLVRIAGHANGGNTPVPVRGFQAYLRPRSKVSRTTNGLFRLPHHVLVDDTRRQAPDPVGSAGNSASACASAR